MSENPFGLSGVLMETTLKPGSPEWVAAGISSSRIAAIVGKSQWASRFAVWHVMAGNLDYDSTETEIQRRGRLLEPAVGAWFAEEHPEFEIHTTGTWHAADNPRLIGSPDRIAVHRKTGKAALVECKTAAHPDDTWGRPGTAEVPDPYVVQTQWQNLTTGSDVCYLPVLTPYLEFAEYVIPRDEQVIEWLAREARAFLDTLPGGKNYRLPPIDGHEATYAAIKRLNPQIQDGSVEIDQDLAARYIEAKAQEKTAIEAARRYAGEVADKLGPFKDAVVTSDGETYKVASRRMGRKGSPPFLVAASNLTRKAA